MNYFQLVTWNVPYLSLQYTMGIVITEGQTVQLLVSIPVHFILLFRQYEISKK